MFGSEPKETVKLVKRLGDSVSVNIIMFNDKEMALKSLQSIGDLYAKYPDSGSIKKQFKRCEKLYNERYGV